MQVSTIKFSQIEDRIDAEYYKPEHLMGEDLILHRKWDHLGNLAESIQYGTTPEEGFFVEEGVPFIRSQNFSLGEFRYEDLVKCTKEFHESHQRSKILPKDVLIAAVGATIGEVGIVPDEPKEGNINQNIARVRVKNKNLAYFVAAFLGSKFGQNQLFRYTTRTAQGYLNTGQIESIKIPIPSESFQKKIEKIVKDAQEKRKLADEKYKEAEEILNKESGLEDLDLSTQKTFEAKFSETNERIDPEYYQPKYYKFWKIVKKRADLKRLQDIITKIDYGTVPTSPYVPKEQGIPYIKGKDVKPNHMVLDDLDYLHKGTKHLIGDKIVKENDILITQMGTVGDAAVIPKEAKDFAFGSFILRIRLKDFSKTNPYYIATIINSPIGKLQIFREMRIATVRANTDIPTIKNLKIPILSKSMQQKISSLIQQSFQLSQEAKELIEETKRKVEEIIEK